MTSGGPPDPPTTEDDDGPGSGRPFYVRLLRLRHIAPNAWQRALLGEGAVVAAVLLVLADLASAWTLLVLPVAVALVVKAHDLVAGLLARPPWGPGHGDGAGPGGTAPSR